MKLTKIEIRNYRSIACVDITPEPACQGFVGINESGKTNILNAISLLSPDIKISKNDERIEGIDEERKQNAYVEFYFKLNANEMQEIVDALLSDIYIKDHLPSFKIAGKEMSIKDLFYSKDTGLYYCNIKSEKKFPRYYTLNEEQIVNIPGLKKKRAKITVESIDTKSGDSIEIQKYSFFEAACINDEDLVYFEDCTTRDLNELFGSLITKFINEHLPQVVYWKYDSKYLLPSSIALQSFTDDPNSCVPLKSMFTLAGYDDINKLISDAKAQKPNVLTGILNKVSKKSSEYLHKVWRDYKNIKFELRANGENIDIHIQDSDNFYACDQRSDGFKRFVTFLLVLSARVNNGEIKDSIIVVDEPDLGIHILGQKNLAQELVKISKNNLVFYSTHSIFMIDRNEPSRHFIVTKKKEVSTIRQVTESNYTDDEVILNALGYSIFEALKQKNIIFEGWADKCVYEIAIASQKGKQIGRFIDVGRVHSTGAKHIIGIAKNLELANREYFVISDSDKPAQDKRKEYIEKEQCVGSWYTYDEFVSEIYTLEDFICHNAFKKSIEHAQSKYSELRKFDYSSFAKQIYKREDFIKNWIKNSYMDNSVSQSIIKEIKNLLYTNIKASDIEDTYYNLLSSLKDKGLI